MSETVTIVCRLSFHGECAGFMLVPADTGDDAVYLVDCACLCHTVVSPANDAPRYV